jgi:hydroxyethylthiazole kinase-like uncharacterized protein yjeF
MDSIEKLTSDNAKELWLPQFPWPKPDGHKYTRGHALVIGGPLETCGAAKLSGTSALKTAAGLVTILAPDEEAMKTYVSSSNLNALMWGTHDKLSGYLADERVSAIIVGPGLGKGEKQERMLDAIVASGKSVVMDADALDKPRVNPHAIITPHEGEFARLFPDMTGTREEKALKAAQITGSVVLLKGPQTIVAAPDGRIFENDPASSYLGTAGSGDTLSGIIGGLLAAGMPSYEAAIAGVYMHSRAGELAGEGLVADNLVEQIPTILRELSPDQKQRSWTAR